MTVDRIHDAILAELGGVAACSPVTDVALAVNWDRPDGFANWWIGGISYRTGLLERREVINAETAVADVAAALQARYFAERTGFVRGH